MCVCRRIHLCTLYVNSILLHFHLVGIWTRIVTVPSWGVSWKPHIFVRPRRPWSTSRSQSRMGYQICRCGKPLQSMAATVLDSLNISTLQRITNVFRCSLTGRSSNSTVAINTRAIQRSTGDNITGICRDFIYAGPV